MMSRDKKIEEDLWNEGVLEERYGGSTDKYQEHLVEQYKICVEMADRISSRRAKVNSFFLAVNTGIVTLIGYVHVGSGSNETGTLYWLTGVAGIVLCYMWYQLIMSYRQLNDWKFHVINELERRLPARPYCTEWEEIVQAGQAKRYKPFTYIEVGVPWVFLSIHMFVVLYSIPWRLFLQFCSAACPY